MPSLGADMEDGKLVEWLVKPGDAISRGDVVAVVETQKGAIEIEIFVGGTIAELCAKEGETIPVGGVMARIESEGEELPAPIPAPEKAPAEQAAPVSRPVPQVAARTGRAKVSPAARRLAAESGIDPEALDGTGVDGAVTLADVEPARKAGAAPAKKRTGFDTIEMRRAIGAAMTRSKREIPHYYLSSTVDLGRALTWLSDCNEGRPPTERMLAAVLLLKATALALRDHPQFNGYWQDDAFQPGAGIHIGWAIALRGGGLVSPAIHDVDALSLPDLMVKLRDLVTRARQGGLRSSELADPTVMVTSLGERGADSVTGIIYPPQVAILGFGRIRERPWVADGTIEVRPLVDMSLAADHRVSDGHAGGLLLDRIEKLLQEPEKL